MKIQYMSDLHLEFESFTPKNAGADILILAGDVAEGGPDKAWMTDCLAEFPYVIYLTGNHEYYNHDIIAIDYEWMNWAKKTAGMFFLNPGCIEIEGKIIIGGCWWTDFWGEYIHAQAVGNGLNDYRLISLNGLPFNTSDAWRINQRTTEYFKNQYKSPDLVITHHGPTVSSINMARYSSRHLDPGYVNNAEDLVFRLSPKYWIHGHTHHNVNYMVGDTNVISNCKGYRNENKEFNTSCIIEL